VTVTFDLDGADAPPPTRDAATVLVLRDAADGGRPEIFFVKRGADVRFMGGAYVFPGGRLDPQDCAAEVPGDLDAATCALRLGDDDPARARGLYVAALRECLEESGILLATGPVAVPTRETLRSVLDARTVPDLAALLRSHDVTLALSALVPLSRWVTPRAETRRFDARFFAALAPTDGHRHATHDGHETVDSAWLTADEAIARALRGEIILSPPTWRTLAELRAFDSAAALLAAAPARLVPIEPRVAADAGEIVVHMPDTMPPSLGGAQTDLPHSFHYRDGTWVPSHARSGF